MEVIDCLGYFVSSRPKRVYTTCVAVRRLRTEGVALLCCGPGGCNDGDAGREDLGAPLDAWYNGSDGVETLDILA